ncbi:hypothetical protein QBC42DRAFT_289577 [Cladorrhinum samala]|uniref:Secreted protein n=1 Tax=Cladorrhinum samala TaxID=585594 RepID=A0AAV9HHW5_9PEZI|nr:hypothetical protein QBC42DRAFT_289577 [Cladorrhinum samala]
MCRKGILIKTLACACLTARNADDPDDFHSNGSEIFPLPALELQLPTWDMDLAEAEASKWLSSFGPASCHPCLAAAQDPSLAHGSCMNVEHTHRNPTIRTTLVSS